MRAMTTDGRAELACPLMITPDRCLARDPFLWDALAEAVEVGEIKPRDALVMVWRTMGGRSWGWIKEYCGTPKASADRAVSKVYGILRREFGTPTVIV